MTRISAPNSPRSRRLRLDPTICRGHGICADVAPELFELDEWGYPIQRARAVADEDLAAARRAADLCPALALRLRRC